MTADEAARLMYVRWLVMPLTNEEKEAIRVLCAELGLPDPKTGKEVT